MILVIQIKNMPNIWQCNILIEPTLYFIINNLTWLIQTALSTQEYLYLHGFSLADPNYKADL